MRQAELDQKCLQKKEISKQQAIRERKEAMRQAELLEQDESIALDIVGAPLADAQEEEEEHTTAGEEDEKKVQSDGNAETPPRTYQPTIRYSPKARDHMNVSEKTKKGLLDMNAENRKKERDGNRRSKRLTSLTPNQPLADNAVQDAPSAETHRHERAQLNNLEADFMKEFEFDE